MAAFQTEQLSCVNAAVDGRIAATGPISSPAALLTHLQALAGLPAMQFKLQVLSDALPAAPQPQQGVVCIDEINWEGDAASQAWQYDCKVWHANHNVAKVLDIICHSLASHPIIMLLLICAFVLVYSFTCVAGSELVVPFISALYKGEYASQTSELQALQTQVTEFKPLRQRSPDAGMHASRYLSKWEWGLFR